VFSLAFFNISLESGSTRILYSYFFQVLINVLGVIGLGFAADLYTQEEINSERQAKLRK
jgi:hypothetical protein